LPGEIISFDSDQLDQIAKMFADEASMVEQVSNYLRSKYEPLRNGDWEGEGAETFFEVMESEIFPKLKKLQEYFAQSAEAASGGSNIIQEAFSKVMAKAKR
jgi:WXG100 family type VII secretion target